MKRVRSVIGLLLALTIIFQTQHINASDMYLGETPDLIKGHATAYCLPGTTASGSKVRDGICAGSEEYFGKTIILYQRLPGDKVGDLIGIYECLDKGGSEGIRKGKVVDIWCEDLNACQEFMNLIYEDDCHGKVFIQVTDAVG